MHEVNIRPAQLDDILGIKNLMDGIFGPFAQMEGLFKKWIADKRFSVQVAHQNKKIIGICTW